MQARLTIEAGEGKPSVCQLVPGQKVSLGRNRGNTVVLSDPHSSRRHAEVEFEGGRWLLRDNGTMNGTRRNGERVAGPVPLNDGDAIGIGDTCLRFYAAADAHGDWPTPPSVPRLHGELSPPSSPEPPSVQTVFLADELTALCAFMQAALKESSPRQAVAGALRTVLDQTRAMTAGYLGFEQDDPTPKLVLPEVNHAYLHLSRELTKRMVREKRLVWLAAEGVETPESVLFLRDAVCAPLAGADGTPLAALHVYKVGETFRERDVRFCEAVAGYLGNCLQVLRARRQLQAENSRLRVRGAAGNELIGDGPAMTKLRQVVARVAAGPGTVLITGESGVGKELVAAALHRHSPRRDGPFVAVNCAALPQALLEGELFGHRKGAFTGAAEDRPGLFEQADEGTIFLDEIGEMSTECQAKLLRVLEHKVVRPVGGTADVEVDVRIVAATNRDLGREAEAGRFRKDLFYRLHIPVAVPPLRDHPEDIPALAEHFLRQLGLEYHREARLTPGALDRLRDYSWPGNVRQLRSVLETAVAMSEGGDLGAADLPLGADRRAPAEGGLPTFDLEALEAQAIRQALKACAGNKSRAARALGIHRETLLAKLKKYGIDEREG